MQACNLDEHHQKPPDTNRVNVVRVSYLPAMMDQRINSAAFVKVLSEPMKILLRVSPSKEMQWETTRNKEKHF